MSLASLPPHAMINGDGDLFYPDGPEDACHFAAFHNAWPVLPLRFPWTEELAAAPTVEFGRP